MPDRPTRPEAESSGGEMEVTPEMIRAGGAIIADRLERPLDWLTEELAREIYIAMVRSSRHQ